MNIIMCVVLSVDKNANASMQEIVLMNNGTWYHCQCVSTLIDEFNKFD